MYMLNSEDRNIHLTGKVRTFLVSLAYCCGGYVCHGVRPHKDRSKGATVHSAKVFSADHLVCVLLGHAGPSGDGRSSRLTAAWPETVWERDSASLTETDTTNVLIKRISCRELTRGHAEDIWTSRYRVTLSSSFYKKWTESTDNRRMFSGTCNWMRKRPSICVPWCTCGQALFSMKGDEEWQDGDVTYPCPSLLLPCCYVPVGRQKDRGQNEWVSPEQRLRRAWVPEGLPALSRDTNTGLTHQV